MKDHLYKKKILGIFICFCVYVNGFSQIAENLYKKEFSKLSLAYNFGTMTNNLSQNNDGSLYPSIGFKNSYSNQFGIYYNFAQTGNFNFKTKFY